VLELQKLCVKSNDRDLRDVNMNIEMENVKNGNEELSIKLSKRCEEKNLKAIPHYRFSH